MIRQEGKETIFKTVAGLMAVVFFWNQIAWSGDLYNPIDEFNADQSQQFAPKYLQEQQVIHEDMVSLQQSIVDSLGPQDLVVAGDTRDPEDIDLELRGPGADSGTDEAVYATLREEITEEGQVSQEKTEGEVVSITTEAGDIIGYRGSSIDFIKKENGTIIHNIVTDGANNLSDAEITHGDGTVQIIESGKTKKITGPNGIVFNYANDERIESVIYPPLNTGDGGRTVFYSYDAEDVDGAVFKTALRDEEKISFYDSDDKIARVRFDTGRIIEYTAGKLSKVFDENGKTYIYEETEEIVAEETVYTVGLKYIIDTEGTVFHMENNNVVEAELPDGVILRNFELDEAGTMISGEIIYKNDPLVLSVLLENERIKKVKDVNHIETTYYYDEISESGGIIKVTAEIKNAACDTEVHTYIRDEETGNITVITGGKEWNYDSTWILRKFSDDEGIVEHCYSRPGPDPPIYAGSIFRLNDDSIKAYDVNRKLTGTTLSDGTSYEYYHEGDFGGKLKKVTLPGGEAVLYDYGPNPEGNLAVYKRISYDDNNFYQNYQSSGYIEHTTNPTFKTTFNLDSNKTYHSMYALAHYYNSNDRSTSLSVNFFDRKPGVSYYVHDYRTDERISEFEELDIPIDKGVDYTIEYIWTDTGVNIYLYESSQNRPDMPAYTLTDNKWDPMFLVNAQNANVILDPSSSGTYTRNNGISTDHSNRLKANPIYTAEFSFDAGNNRKFLNYGFYSHTDTSYDSVYFDCYSNVHQLRAYHYDYETRQNTDEIVPLDIVFNDNTTYVFEAKMEDNVLDLYIYEKGNEPGSPVYTLENIEWVPQFYCEIDGGEVCVEAYDDLETYEYDDGSGNLIVYGRTSDDEKIIYDYDENRNLISKELILKNNIKKTYDTGNRLIREEKPNGEITVYEYDESGSIVSIAPEFPEGTSLTYYRIGDFIGKLRKAIFPEGNAILYDYKWTPEGNLAVYKRASYDDKEFSQSYCGNSNTNYATNPTLKVTFNSDYTGGYSSAYAGASCRDDNGKSVSLSLSFHGQKAYVYYRNNYGAGQTLCDSKCLNATINGDIDYTVEYVWTDTGVDVYLYESSQNRPDVPVYAISENAWNPKFSMSIENGSLILDPSSSGTYARSNGISTDYSNPLKTDLIHIAEFEFDQDAGRKSLFSVIYGQTDAAHGSIRLNCYDGTPGLDVYHRDHETSQSINETIPLDAVFKDDTTYVFETKVEDNALDLYMYEKGNEPGSPIYTLENIKWYPQFYSYIDGGELRVEAYDNLEVCEYNLQAMPLFDREAEENLQNKNIIIDDPYKTLPDHCFGSTAPLVFPDGITDLINNTRPKRDFSITLPADMFTKTGEIKTDHDFTDTPFFEIIKYGQDQNITEIIKPTGDIVTYKNGMVDTVLGGSGSTSYAYTLSELENIETIEIDRDGIKRIYDEYGNLKSIGLDSAATIVYENGQVKEIQKSDGKTIKNITFSDSGELFGGLISYPDGTVAYYNDDNLLEIIKSGSGDTVHYGDGKIRTVTLADGSIYDWSYEGELIKIHDRVHNEYRWYLEGFLQKVEELSGAQLTTNYFYLENALIESTISRGGRCPLYVQICVRGRFDPGP